MRKAFYVSVFEDSTVANMLLMAPYLGNPKLWNDGWEARIAVALQKEERSQAKPDDISQRKGEIRVNLIPDMASAEDQH
jgi:hypothetical protein